MASIGKQLHHARESLDLTLEDVAFKTHIPAARLGDLENDDFSNFANLTYARGFLKLYSQFLEVDISHYLGQFDMRDLAAVSGHEYMQTAKATLSMPQMLYREEPQRRGGWLLLAGAAVLIGVPVAIWRLKGKETEQGPAAESAQSAAANPAPVAPPADQTSRTSAQPRDAAESGGDGPPVEVRPALNVPTPKATVIDESEEQPPPKESANARGNPR